MRGNALPRSLSARHSAVGCGGRVARWREIVRTWGAWGLQGVGGKRDASNQPRRYYPHKGIFCLACIDVGLAGGQSPWNGELNRIIIFWRSNHESHKKPERSDGGAWGVNHGRKPFRFPLRPGAAAPVPGSASASGALARALAGQLGKKCGRRPVVFFFCGRGARPDAPEAGALPGGGRVENFQPRMTRMGTDEEGRGGKESGRLGHWNGTMWAVPPARRAYGSERRPRSLREGRNFLKNFPLLDSPRAAVAPIPMFATAAWVTRLGG